MSKNKGIRKDGFASDHAPSNAVASDEGVIDAVALSPALWRLIAQYAEPREEFQRLLALAKWDGGLERWRRADNPPAYIATWIRNEALRMLKQERPNDAAELSEDIADEGDAPRADLNLSDVDSDVAKIISARSAGVAWKDTPGYLGWDPKRVEASRGRLRRLRPQAGRPTGTARLYRERFDSGKWCFSFQPSDFTALEAVIAGERKNIFVTSRPKPAVASLIPIGGAIVNQNELESKLRVERLRFDKIVVRGAEIRDQLDKSETALVTLRAALKADVEESLLAEREPDTRLRKRVEAGEGELTRLREQSNAHGGAVIRQRDVIQAIENEIAATARARMLERVGPKFAQFDALVDEMVGLAFDASQDMQGHFVAPAELLPEARDLTESGLRLALFHDALRLRAHLVRSYSDHGFEVKRTA
jgi:hypothetical protein